jgi:hypothetical protein
MEAERIGGSPPAGGRNARNVSVIAVFRKKTREDSQRE